MEKIGLITVKTYGIKQSRQFLVGQNQVRERCRTLCLMRDMHFLHYLKHRCLIIGVEKTL
uniref:Uncharacterized protein n=1 Tax=Podoviridae sp. ctG4L18 TaxID=2825234 RepID=A0A8S5UNU0_9CAUD|nr:MAG TPA: hypothetical protein [Podoviridae sp. ctG4L18]